VVDSGVGTMVGAAVQKHFLRTQLLLNFFKADMFRECLRMSGGYVDFDRRFACGKRGLLINNDRLGRSNVLVSKAVSQRVGGCEGCARSAGGVLGPNESHNFICRGWGDKVSDLLTVRYGISGRVTGVEVGLRDVAARVKGRVRKKAHGTIV